MSLNLVFFAACVVLAFFLGKLPGIGPARRVPVRISRPVHRSPDPSVRE